MTENVLAPVTEHLEVAYSPIIARPKVTWPGGARVALWIAPNVEFYEFEPPHNPHRNPYPRLPYPPDVLMYSYKDYGNRVGFWRLAEVLDRYALRATVSINMAVLDKYPEVCEAMVERDWDFLAHGIFNSRFFLGLAEAEERELLRDTIHTVKRRTGKTLKGFFGPDGSATENTMRLLGEEGLIYSCEWYCDDQPFPINVPTGKLVGVPYSWEVNDGVLGVDGLVPFNARAFEQIIRDQFDVLYEEGAESGRVMCIAIHPYISGRKDAIASLDRALRYVVSHPGVWATTADEIAEHYIAHHYDPEIAYLRGKAA